MVTWYVRGLRRRSKQLTLISPLGNPGSGKTILAGAIIDKLRNQVDTEATHPTTVAYHFFNANLDTEASRDNAYRSIAKQIYSQFRQEEKIHNVFAMATMSTGSGQKCTKRDVSDLITLCLPHVPNFCLVLDGVDECTDDDDLIVDLSQWSSEFPIKIILISRSDTASIRQSNLAGSVINLQRQDVQADIELLLREEMAFLVKRSLFPTTMNFDDAITNLVKRADGMFLWARLMIGYLRCPGMTKLQRLKAAMDPELETLDRLEDMYRRIHARIVCLGRHSKALALTSLIWAAYASLNSAEMMAAVNSFDWEKEEDGGSVEFDNALLISCCGLVEKRHTGSFHIIHLTAKMFLKSNTTSPAIENFPILNEPDAKSIMASRCISYLANSLPSGPLGGRLGLNAERDTLLKGFPFLPFACKNWVFLCVESLMLSDPTQTRQKTLEMMKTAENFLGDSLSLMAWIEAWYTLQESAFLTLYLLPLNQVSFGYSHSPLGSEFENFVATLRHFDFEMRRLDTDWRPTLCKDPSEIWGDISAFFHCSFLRSTKAVQVETLGRVLDPAAERSKAHLKPTFSISMNSSDGQALVVLNIFPSK